VEEMKNLDQVQQPFEESLWFGNVTRLWTYAVKKQASRGLKKTIDDVQ
jgi:hypothetical protein